MDSAQIPAPFRSDIEKALAVLCSFGTKEVYLFGSLTSDSWREDSDIDLAVSGMAPELYLKAHALASRGLDHERPIGDFLRETDRLVRIA